jgi:hypothetical protein
MLFSFIFSISETPGKEYLNCFYLLNGLATKDDPSAEPAANTCRRILPHKELKKKATGACLQFNL